MKMTTQTLETKEAALGTPTRHVGHYALRRELGRGGMSVVYEALDTRTGQPVALKLLTLPPTLDAAETNALVARFEREARTVARLSHPNVIGIHEIGVVGGQHFLAMEFLRGQTLRQRLTQSRLMVRDACSILTQIAGALDAVHAAGIVHRDVKASNVMLLPDGTAKLLDFGIARSEEEAEITSAGAILGTPSYMAPEQVRGEPAAVTTDLWSLGVLSYEMLTGRLPFAGQVVANVLYQVLNSPPDPMPALPKAVQKVLRRALDKDPALRYPSAAALAGALGSALPKTVLPESALPKPAAAVLPSMPRRSVPRWALGTALLLLFLGAFGLAALHRHSAPAKLSFATVQPNFVPTEPRDAAISAPPPAVAVVSPPPSASVPVIMPPPPAVPPAFTAPRSGPEATQVLPVAAVPALSHDPSPRPYEPSPRRFETPRSAPPNPGPAAPAMEAALPEHRPSAAPPAAAHRTVRAARTPDTTTLQAQGTEQAQAAVQSVALPAGGEGDDPEADARLRKSTWSQSDTPPAAPN